MKKLAFAGFILVLAITGCQQELSEEEFVYRGDWDSKNYALQIYQNGYGKVNSNKLGVPLTLEGRVNIKGDRIIFTSTSDESTLPRKRFTINQSPDVDASGITYMILDNERFEKR